MKLSFKSILLLVGIAAISISHFLSDKPAPDNFPDEEPEPEPEPKPRTARKESTITDAEVITDDNTTGKDNENNE